MLQLLFFVIAGAISGFLALGLELVVETAAQWVGNWQQVQRSFSGMVLRQLVEIAPIEEGCKLVAVVVMTSYLQRKYHLRATTVFLFSMAVAVGFTAEENWMYLAHEQGSILGRIISTPVQTLFSAPWGYALGIYIASSIRFDRDRNLIYGAWLNAVICHALANILSLASSYSAPLSFLYYGFFPFLLWMFWRLEQLLRKIQGKRLINLISGYKLWHRYWRWCLILLVLMLGGNAISGLFLLVEKLIPLKIKWLFDREILQFVVSKLLLYALLATGAVLIYKYLRHSARRWNSY
jgi:RsiW-degrading membrane proteinase PrsW (M82 family)